MQSAKHHHLFRPLLASRSENLVPRIDSGETKLKGMATNKVLPPNIIFPLKAPGSTRLVAWNVCGLASSQKKGFNQYLQAEDPDLLVLTETKVNNPPVDPELMARFPHRSWSISDTKGYAGTAILSKMPPLSVSYNLPGYDNPAVVKGRVITLEYPGCWVVGTYVPNAGQNLKALDVKVAWNSAFEAYIRELDTTKPVIWLGDLNVAPTSKDLKNDKTNWNKTAGYTEAECTAFARTLAKSSRGEGNEGPQFLDIWRELHPNEEAYTYFSYRFNCRTKQIGWRLDFFILSERLRPRVKMCEIR
ncbi:hypothetical protein BS47DRAFT_634127 [Hydnum rufescens UP504]|uniref:Endonuclease/exonuclease/phosphatase domain-containing protein n=1 Tax=Hydnum rufescens UP504 TaxID=1448309 RepID=A0A9P6BBM7_9AGAM|nr:hypothetical protein BS47DRAFT_634127 [Hydnum rufescens UP504]